MLGQTSVCLPLKLSNMPTTNPCPRQAEATAHSDRAGSNLSSAGHRDTEHGSPPLRAALRTVRLRTILFPDYSPLTTHYSLLSPQHFFRAPPRRW
jgi:hypothetical protein